MKIEKTEKEFRQALAPAMSQLGSYSMNQRLAAVIAALDLEFLEEPKEPAPPSLPERLHTRGGEIVTTDIGGCERTLTPEEGREAAARYNTLEKLFRGALIPASPDVLATLRRLIAEERERLQMNPS